VSTDAAFGSAGTSLAALAAKKPLGRRTKPACSTGMTGKSSGVGVAEAVPYDDIGIFDRPVLADVTR
jgi:hypothetical protein